MTADRLEIETFKQVTGRSGMYAFKISAFYYFEKLRSIKKIKDARNFKQGSNIFYRANSKIVSNLL